MAASDQHNVGDDAMCKLCGGAVNCRKVLPALAVLAVLAVPAVPHVSCEKGQVKLYHFPHSEFVLYIVVAELANGGDVVSPS
jgi:hypothetical protein